MDTATTKMTCIAAVTLAFCSFIELKASGKEKPLLRVHESIKGGWYFFLTEHHSLEVTQSGRVSLKKGTKVMLSSAELQALRNFLDSGPVRNLQDSYYAFGMCRDCGAHSMKIEITVGGETKRVSLIWRGELRSKNYPVSLHDLVCKVYGLEERVGIPYRRTVRVDPDGHKSFDPDTWCDAASVGLVPNP